MFPLGELSKSDARQAARDNQLAVAEKKESQEICFVPDGDYAKVVSRLKPEAAAPGDIVDTDGRVLGRHDGIIHFTVGQRRGLGVAAPDPLYVVALDAERRRVIVGPKSALGSHIVRLSDVNWLDGAIPADGRAVAVKLRSAQPPVAATIHPRDGALEVVLGQPGHVAAPGQACVIYDGDRVLGGGWIARA